VLNVYRPLVAGLADNARHHLFKRVATLAASVFKVQPVARNHGSGFLHGSYLQSKPVLQSLLYPVQNGPNGGNHVPPAASHVARVPPTTPGQYPFHIAG
jgi:hypothetical protein